MGNGKSLVDAAVHWEKERSLNGISLENRFYQKYGFRLGGFDTQIYTREYK